MIQIDSIEYIPIDFTTQPTNYLLGVKDERISVEIVFKAVWRIFGNSETKITFSSNSISITDEDNDPIDNIWEKNEFKIGDIVEITGSVSNNATTRAITSFSPDGSIASFSNGYSFINEINSKTAILNGATQMTGVTFLHNLIENQSSVNYNSLVDGNENKYSLSGLTSTSYIDLIHQGAYKSNKNGSVKIKKLAGLNQFSIIHTFNIIPFSLSDDLTDIINNVQPSYLLDDACLKYIYEIKLHKTLANPNYIHKSDTTTFLLGNTGGFGENFNKGIPEYVLNSIIFKNSAGTVIPSLDYSKINTVEILIDSINGKCDTPNKFVLVHSYIPINTSEYINTITDLEDNFMFDIATKTIGYNITSIVNGLGFGTEKQVFKNVRSTIIGSNQFKIIAEIDLSSNYKSKLDKNGKNFYLSVITSNHQLTTELSDKVNVKAYTGKYIFNVSNSNVGTLNTDFWDFTEESIYGIPNNGSVGNRGSVLIRIFNIGGSSSFALTDSINNKIIGISEYNTSFNYTMALLLHSINNNIPHGSDSLFPILPQPTPAMATVFDSTGWNASNLVFHSNSGFNYCEFEITAPIGSLYNKIFPLFTGEIRGNLGDYDVFDISGGADAIVTNTEINAFVEDWIIGRSIFSVDVSKQAVIKNVKVQIYATHANYGNFNLEIIDYNIGTPIIVLFKQIINIKGQKGYKMGNDNIFNEYSILNRHDLDNDAIISYELRYPFKVRWEDFLSLPNASNQFYDINELNNGKNNDWNRYFSKAGWELKYKVEVTITENGFDNIIEKTNDLSTWNYNDATDWTYSIKTYDFITGLEITGNVLIDTKTIIKANFQKIGVQPDISSIQGIIGIEVTNAGGDKTIREILTNHVHENDSPFVSLNYNKLLKKEKIGSDYILSAALDNNKLKTMFPNATSFDITCRIIEKEIIYNKSFQDGSTFLFQDGSIFTLN